MNPKSKPLRGHDQTVNNPFSRTRPSNGHPLSDTETTSVDYLLNQLKWYRAAHQRVKKFMILSVVMGFVFGFWVGFLYHGGF